MRSTGVKFRPVRKIEPLQVKIIHTAASALHLSDLEYRDILQGQYKVASCKALTYVQASRLIDYFKTLGFKINKPPRHESNTGQIQFYPRGRQRTEPLPANVFVLPSRDQMDMIGALAEKITWKVEDGFQHWLKKYIKIDRIKTAGEASDAIEGLKGLLAHSEPVAKPKANYPRSEMTFRLNEVDGGEDID